ncbi:TetR family transcriptional regulator [Acinetobacter sp. ANC 4558]|uniref:TetR/AcrR family transcriptional regulator n=1 Tax=Acinetobacter sp. ANC 4558 TaxID=1977876 RepID=UPI000A3539C4|nr:TetR/AcrR family transcriptional regulator [Acinetobacter sp. ANC 4558]OTG85915.1 TetR family transcriptional regulator [Acinetobacter sp. ANC 4558]
MNTKTAKEKILEAASTLFYNQGINQTGINMITDKAAVAKMSLYNNFPSKADLITAYIEARHAEWLALYEKRLQQATSPQEGILAVFDAYRDHAEDAYENGFRGCGLLNAAAEFASNSPERMAVKLHKDEVEDILTVHLKMIFQDTQQVQYIASLLSFLLEGSIARAGLESSSDKLIMARKMAENILQTPRQQNIKI